MLDSLGALLGAALALDREALATLASAPLALRSALLVALLGGVSLTIGQSVVLFANRVSPGRFVLLLALGALVYAFGLVVWAATIWLASTYGFRRPIELAPLVFAVCVGQAPMIYGALILLPYVGTGVQRFLAAYALVVVVAALSAVLGIRVWEAVVLAAAGWLLRALLDTLLSRPLGGVRLWLWRAASGQPTRLHPSEVLAGTRPLSAAERAEERP
jgi:hypothetical protein